VVIVLPVPLPAMTPRAQWIERIEPVEIEAIQP
jgi:hypothetical protein